MAFDNVLEEIANRVTQNGEKQINPQAFPSSEKEEPSQVPLRVALKEVWQCVDDDRFTMQKYDFFENDGNYMAIGCLTSQLLSALDSWQLL